MELSNEWANGHDTSRYFDSKSQYFEFSLGRRVQGALDMGQKQPTLNYIAALCGDLSKLATSAGHPLLSYLLEVARLEAQQRASPKPDAGNQAAEGDEVGLWVWDMRNDRCIADRYAAELYGLPTDAVAPGLPVESYFACIHPDDRDFARRCVDAALQSGSLQMDYRILRPDGSVKKVRTRGLVTFDNAGNPTSLAGTDTDISDYESVRGSQAEAAPFRWAEL